MSKKRLFYFFIHIFFLSGLLYAFAHFVRTPRVEVLERRLWAYENWIILSFYSLFVYFTLRDAEMKIKTEWFKEVLGVNLLLLIFPWGLFLLLGPEELLSGLGLSSVYWRVLGAGSLIGALIYYFPYRFYRKKISFYILVFGAVDNFLAGLVLSVLFFKGKLPLFAWSATPLLFYFSWLFARQAKVWGRG